MLSPAPICSREAAHDPTLCPQHCARARPHLVGAGYIWLYVCCQCYALESGHTCSCPAPVREGKAVNDLAETLSFQLRTAGLADFEREYRFDSVRRWRSDLAFVGERLLIECDGGQWLPRAGHSSGRGRERDCEKDCAATIAGWRVLRFTTSMIEDGRAVDYVRRALGR